MHCELAVTCAGVLAADVPHRRVPQLFRQAQRPLEARPWGGRSKALEIALYRPGTGVGLSSGTFAGVLHESSLPLRHEAGDGQKPLPSASFWLE